MSESKSLNSSFESNTEDEIDKAYIRKISKVITAIGNFSVQYNYQVICN